ncbi:MAG TPA: histidine kinase [Bryobacteraceae bacterium]|nr:histidine kinase [Bryobacteraceae bacterium]
MKLAVAASFASVLVRFSAFQRMLMREERTLLQRVKLALGCSGLLGAGVAIRISNPAYTAVDLGLEGSMISGLVGGYVTGLLSGVLISIPAMLNGELMSMPLFAGVGVLGGLLRDLAPEKEDVWRFSPFLDLSLYRLVRQRQDFRKTAFHLTCVLAAAMAELLRLTVARLFGAKGVFTLEQHWTRPDAFTVAAVYLTTILTITLPLKIWNNTRNEKKLEEQQHRLNEARLAALTSQINPHFLFNTLNSVSSLIRTNPEQARSVVYKLSSILRRLLRKTENLSPLRDELSFIDNYMAIELVRFGDKLKFVKDIAPETEDRLIPSMLLQPLIENSIRHGLSSKVEGGTIQVKTWLEEQRLHIVVDDDGVGIPEARLATLFELGIGVSNVNERLKVLFGGDYRMWIDSKPGEGTRTGIEIPELQAGKLAAVS